MKLACFHKSVGTYAQDTRQLTIRVTDFGEFEIRATLGEISSAITISKSIFKKRTKYVGFLSFTDGIILVDDWRLNSSIESKSFIRNHYRVPEDVCFNIYFHDTFEESLIFCNWPVTTALPVDELKKGVWVHDYIATQFDGYEAYRTKLIAKRKALLGVNILDSVVALEQQIDLITALLVALFEERELPQWTQDFKQAVVPHSVLNTRTAAAILEDLQRHKAAVRELQATYLANREGNDA